jgi:hypothetical protein
LRKVVSMSSSLSHCSTWCCAAMFLVGYLVALIVFFTLI